MMRKKGKVTQSLPLLVLLGWAMATAPGGCSTLEKKESVKSDYYAPIEATPRKAASVATDSQSDDRSDQIPDVGPPPDGCAAVVQEENWPSGITQSRVEGYTNSEGEFVRHGMSEVFYDSGHPRSRMYWKHGVPHGSRETWYLDGTVWSKGRYVNGLEDGTWTRWHQSGGKHSEWTLHLGAWHGTYTEWHENGFKRLEVEFVNGKQQGPMKKWDEQGVVTEVVDFVDGVEQP